MHRFFLILELIGTVAFSLSGTLTGIQKKMDLLGVMILMNKVPAFFSSGDKIGSYSK